MSESYLNKRKKKTTKNNYESTSPRPQKRRTSAGSDHRVGQRASLFNNDSRDSQDRRDSTRCKGVIGDIVRFLAKYVVLPEDSYLVTAAWIVAAYLVDEWDRFPHLAITSPEKRCGKSLLLELLSLLVPKPRLTANISPAALYRLTELERPTLLIDESQSLSRRGSEASEVIREMLNAGIAKSAKVMRCGGEGHDKIEEFSVYSPKVLALIGNLDQVLADRSLPVQLRRKTRTDKVERYRSRMVEKEATTLHTSIENWAQDNSKQAAAIYDTLDPFNIENDRMAELLLPLQAVLRVIDDSESIDKLRSYAEELDKRDREQEMQSPGVMLLNACRELFSTSLSFISTGTLISSLVSRAEEPWHRWNSGQPISSEALAGLLRQYGIRPKRDKKQTKRGYFRSDFQDAWERYLPENYPSNLSNSDKQQ